MRSRSRVVILLVGFSLAISSLIFCSDCNHIVARHRHRSQGGGFAERDCHSQQRCDRLFANHKIGQRRGVSIP